MTAGELVQLEAVKQISPRVIRILGGNPGPFTLQGTNSYIIGTGKRRILLDTTEPGITAYTDSLKKVLQQFDITLQEIIITHHHIDHVGGIGTIINDVLNDRSIRISKMKFEDARNEVINDCQDLQYNYIEDGEIIRTEGATLQAIHTPGHTSDHMALILQEDSAIFSGDCILGQGTAVFEDLFKLFESLKRMLTYPCQLIYPGHGPIIQDAKAKINEYIAHRQQRENQIFDALRTVNGKLMTSKELTQLVYQGIPDEYMLQAEENLILTLRKLLVEGRVVKIGDEATGTVKWSLPKI